MGAPTARYALLVTLTAAILDTISASLGYECTVAKAGEGWAVEAKRGDHVVRAEDPDPYQAAVTVARILGMDLEE